MDQVESRVSQAVNDLIVKLELEHVRPLQRKAFLCSARCCESHSSRESVQRCLEQCASPVTHSQKHINDEMQRFQERLQRCVLTCHDKCLDKENEKGRGEFERCVVTCGEEHVSLLPSMFKRMAENVRKLEGN
ncbi:protein FAM136A-like [Corticium candelabrum]|uniref:protein FAM136A-like n=1 Tax=Corticium candelabrum TaxID=121492 RepID=UPI002E26406A|nr:protein FAM136A-like [Corticium candelabrum]